MDELVLDNSRQQRLQSYLIQNVALELESIRHLPRYDGIMFPKYCRKLVSTIQGNQYCVDCNNCNPTWASVSYGTLLCLHCSGKHRSYGVQISFVRSLDYDTWNYNQIVSLLEGGNDQLKNFFQRHNMLSSKSDLFAKRYYTNGAKYYREHLQAHIQAVSLNGLYKGRDYNRLLTTSSNHSSTSKTSNTITKKKIVLSPTSTHSTDSTSSTFSTSSCTTCSNSSSSMSDINSCGSSTSSGNEEYELM